MKLFFAAVLLSSSIFSPVLADEISLASKLSDVTVYPRGARVTRVVAGEVQAGEHVIKVEDLPGQVVANSVRVEGASGAKLEVGSVDVRQVFIAGDDRSGERQELENRIELLKDEIAALSLEIKNANTQRSMLKALAGQAVVPAPRGETKSIIISAEELSSLLALTGERFAEFSQITEKARIRQRELTRKIDELNRQLIQLAPKQQMRTQVAINLNAGGAGQAEFRITYNINEAGWAPLYDAKLTLGDTGKDSAVKIVRRASVRQSTTEKWENVSLTLSTARPKGNTQVPKLSPYILSEYQQYLSKLRNKKRSAIEVEEMAAQAPAADAEVVIGRAVMTKHKMEFKQVAEENSGFLVEYKISGAVSVANNGVEKNVVIGAKTLPAEIAAHAVPVVDPSAYLTAQFKLEGSAPWLPGTVTLSRDQVFLGKSRLPLLNPGQEYSLGFGRDDFVKIERVQVTDKKGESGFISSVNVEEREYVTNVTNLHDFPMKVIVQDQLPYGTHEDIVVEMMSGSTRPTETDVDKQRGILAWENLIGAKSEKIIKFGYKVSWPKDMNITPVR
ncbi:MAG: mucoidy inhibitor MuiA family protein [Hyphomicrobiales bacterium]|nr:mucoidy inhibitor MuiA family protein [Hyphomicrobiales bacterium]